MEEFVVYRHSFQIPETVLVSKETRKPKGLKIHL